MERVAFEGKTWTSKEERYGCPRDERIPRGGSSHHTALNLELTGAFSFKIRSLTDGSIMSKGK